ncbi:DNA/pantothenate metabolism flavoprotein, partial [Mycena latifolia]
MEPRSYHPMPEPTPTFSAEAYFATQPAPPLLAQDLAGVQELVARQAAQNRNVVLVTSGGTTVPLELNVVRFLDNFSAGTRGATSAEYFLKAGYAGTVGITPAKRADADLLAVLTAYKRVQAAGTLHTLTFVTVDDYLWLLRAVSQTLSALRRRAMYYLAAAVSDFFLPRQEMSEHKIQSGKGSLHIEMDQVPKVLKPMVEEWTRDGYIVSFKLETDAHLLIPKTRAALERYGHQVVIGNELHTRKVQVFYFTASSVPMHLLSAQTAGARPRANPPTRPRDLQRRRSAELVTYTRSTQFRAGVGPANASTVQLVLPPAPRVVSALVLRVSHALAQTSPPLSPSSTASLVRLRAPAHQIPTPSAACLGPPRCRRRALHARNPGSTRTASTSLARCSDRSVERTPRTCGPHAKPRPKRITVRRASASYALCQSRP